VAGFALANSTLKAAVATSLACASLIEPPHCAASVGLVWLHDVETAESALLRSALSVMDEAQPAAEPGSKAAQREETLPTNEDAWGFAASLESQFAAATGSMLENRCMADWTKPLRSPASGIACIGES